MHNLDLTPLVEGLSEKIRSKRSETRPRIESSTVAQLAGGNQFYMDFIYNDYNEVLDNDKAFAELKDDKERAKVAVVGAGISGLATAYNLLRSGVNVDLYEATVRGNSDTPEYGGRLYSYKSGGDSLPSVELGAMRFPGKSRIFWKYLNTIIPKLKNPSFEVTTEMYPFPNPGVAATAGAYFGVCQYYGNREPIPRDFEKILEKVTDAFNRFTYDDVTFNNIIDWLSSTDAVKSNQQEIINFFQGFLNQYRTWSLGQFVKASLKEGGASLTEEEDYIFYYLGFGTGGFGPLYPIALSEILRLLAWKFGDEYKLPVSSSNMAKLFFNVCDPQKRTEAEQEYGEFKFYPKVPVTSVRTLNKVPGEEGYNDNDATQITVIVEGEEQKRFYSRVVAAMSHRAYQTTLHLDSQTVESSGYINSFIIPGKKEEDLKIRSKLLKVLKAFKQLHSLSASKIFTLIPNFYTNPDIDWPDVRGEKIGMLLSDGEYLQSYYLKNRGNEANPEKINVLASYLWGDESRKYQALQYVDGDNNKAESWFENLEKVSFSDWEPYKFVTPGKSVSIVWEDEPYIHAGFKLPYPDEELGTAALAYQYQFAADEDIKESVYNRVYLAGESCSFSGGWVEGALISAINASAGVLKSLKDRYSLNDDVEPLFNYEYPYTDPNTPQ